jgi:hypothetical protein
MYHGKSLSESVKNCAVSQFKNQINRTTKTRVENYKNLVKIKDMYDIYLDVIKCQIVLSSLTKFRISAHKLKIERISKFICG